MSIIICQHHSERPPGRITRVLTGYAIRLDIRRLDQGDSLPPDLDNVEALIALDSTRAFADASLEPWFKRECELAAAAHQAGRPLIGIGFGAELIAHALGGKVVHSQPPPVLGWTDMRMTFPGTIDTICSGQPWRSVQFLTRTDHVQTLPPGAAPLFTSSDRCVRAFQSGVRTYAFQFNIELEQAALNDISILQASDRRPRAEELIRQTGQNYAQYDRLSFRLIRSLADYLLPLTRPVRS